MNFYVGQEVVCIKKHSRNAVIKGNHYFINALMKCKGCNDVFVDVGIRVDTIRHVCVDCYAEINPHGVYWIDSSLFAPIESIPTSHEIAVKKLIEESQTILN